MGARIAVAPAVAMWAGALAGLAGAPAAYAFALVPLAALALVRGRRWPGLAGLALPALFALAGALLGAAHRGRIEVQRAQVEAGDGLFRLEVTVMGPGARGGEWIEARVTAAAPPLIAGTRLHLRMPEGRPAVWGDRLACLATLEVAPGRRNPGGFDARAADFARGIAARGRIHAIARHDSTGAGAWPRATVARWRRAVERLLDAHLDDTARAYAIPLMIGDRSGLSPEQRARVRDAGLAHLLALSGLHVAWLAWLTRAAVIAAGGGRIARALAGAAAALAYLGLAGPLPALARAATTELLAAVARATQRALDPLQALALSVVLLIAWRPGWALDLGFQLSCAATCGLVLAVPVHGAEPAAPAWRRRIGTGVRATAAAQLAAGPLLVTRFHGLSWSVWLANLPAVPAAGLLLALLWGAVLADLAAPGSGAPLWAACGAAARVLDTIARAAAALPSAFLPCGAGVALLLAAAGVCLAAGRLSKPALLDLAPPPGGAVHRAHALGAVLALAALVVLLVPAPLRPAAGRVWVVTLDIGQGDAIALAAADGWWLIDAGPRAPGYDAGESIVVPFFRWAGVRRLSGLLVTHMDADHSGGARAVWRALDPARVVGPDSGAALLRPPRRAAWRRTAAGDTLRTDPALIVLWPPAEFRSPLRNERSAVTLLEVGGTRALFMADADSVVEARLAPPPGVRLLKAGHHGARSSSAVGFLARVAPELAVISAGRGNRFGHPHPEVLERLAAAGVGVRRTDREGAIWIELSKGAMREVDWRRSAPGRARTAAVPAAPALRTAPRCE